MQTYYYFRKERTRDWRVYKSWIGSCSAGEGVAMHTTRNGAAADTARRNRLTTGR